MVVKGSVPSVGQSGFESRGGSRLFPVWRFLSVVPVFLMLN
jgi:hypothetical protein